MSNFDIDMHIPVSRADAIALGATRFRTGKPCKRGHLAERFVTNSSCVECHKLANRKSRKRKTRR